MNNISERGDSKESVLKWQTPSLFITHEIRSDLRNLNPLIKELCLLGLKVDPNSFFLRISKKYGTYLIDLRDGMVGFTPTTCEMCWNRISCPFAMKKLCIIEVSQGWVNFPLVEVDLFILSIIFAILYDLLPENLLEQIKKVSRCTSIVSRDINLRDFTSRMLQDDLRSIKIQITYLPKAPPIQGPVPPPK